MPPRYPHLWTRKSWSSLPANCATVAVDARAEIDRHDSTLRRWILCGWHVIVWRARKGKLVRSADYAGLCPREFWRRIDSAIRATGSLWLYGSRVADILTLLDFWLELEDGRFYFPDQRDSYSQGNDSGGSAGHAPALVLEDPPTVVIAGRPGQAGTVKIVDLRNYGVDHDEWQGTASVRAKAQADWIQSAMSLLALRGLGSWSCTAGSQGVSSLRTKHLGQRIGVHTHGPALRLERDSYHGGRCESFHIGRVEGPLFYLDVRSMYPFVAWHNDLPLSLAEYHDQPDEATVSRLVGDSLCIADVSIRTEHADYPVIATLSRQEKCVPVRYWTQPYRGEPRGQVIYPVGSYRAALAGPELVDALMHRRITAWHRIAAYYPGRPLSAFMAEWYSIKEDADRRGDRPTESWAKAVMNSTVGKLGESGKSWEIVPRHWEHPPYAYWREVFADGSSHMFRNIAGVSQHLSLSPESAESVPHLAAWITSLARVKLLHLLRAAGRENVYYCDTDCLLCNQTAYEILRALGEVDENRIGYLRVKGEYQWCHFYGIKHYQCEKKIVCAGLPRGNVTISAEDGAAWWRGTAVDQAMSGGTPVAQDYLRSYYRARAYRHGRVLDGGRVEPWRLTDEDATAGTGRSTGESGQQSEPECL